jgi:hypothetical protein
MLGFFCQQLEAVPSDEDIDYFLDIFKVILYLLRRFGFKKLVDYSCFSYKI